MPSRSAASRAYRVSSNAGSSKPDRERLHGTARGALHQAGDDGRVDPAGQEGAQRHVGDHLLAHRLVERRAQAFGVLAGGGVDLGVPVGLPVAVERQAPRAPDGVMGRRQLVHALQDRRRVGDVPIRQITVQGERVDAARRVPSAGRASSAFNSLANEMRPRSTR